MGQYHVCCSLDKREFIHPHQLGDGLKLWEQAANGPGGIGSALIALLAVSNGRGGGDFVADDPDHIVGRWGGDRIAIVGDYADAGDLPRNDRADLIYALCETRAGDVADTVSHLRRLHQESGNEDFEEQADSLEKQGPFTDITVMVRDFLEREKIARYVPGEGWIQREATF